MTTETKQDTKGIQKGPRVNSNDHKVDPKHLAEVKDPLKDKKTEAGKAGQSHDSKDSDKHPPIGLYDPLKKQKNAKIVEPQK